MTDARGLFVELDEGEVAESEEIAPGVIVELAEDRQPLAVEIVDVGNTDPDVLSRALMALNLAEAEVATVVEALNRAKSVRE